MEVSATRTIAAPPERVFAHLAQFDRHWELLGRRLQPLRAYDGRRSQARLRGPLGVHRTLWIELAALQPPRELTGRVEAGRGRTVGTVRWVLRHAAPSLGDEDGRGQGGALARGAEGGDARRAEGRGGRGAGTTVELTARTEVAGALDRLLLLCGGRRWLRRSLELVLARLEARLAQ